MSDKIDLKSITLENVIQVFEPILEERNNPQNIVTMLVPLIIGTIKQETRAQYDNLINPEKEIEKIENILDLSSFINIVAALSVRLEILNLTFDKNSTKYKHKNFKDFLEKQFSESFMKIQKVAQIKTQSVKKRSIKNPFRRRNRKIKA